MRALSTVLASATLVACSSYQLTPVSGGYAPGHPIDVLYEAPNRPYQVVGTVSATRYKPGFTDPTVSDAMPQLEAAAAKVNADAVIVRSTRSNNDRHIVVEAEAIRYTRADGVR